MDTEKPNYLTPQEITGSQKLFYRNEHFRLTGQWFIPLPCHFWQFEKGMEFDVDYGEEIISLTFSDPMFDGMFAAFINKYEWQHFQFSEIKRMRIKSFEVKNDPA
jgi:hypothetical protein